MATVDHHVHVAIDDHGKTLRPSVSRSPNTGKSKTNSPSNTRAEVNRGRTHCTEGTGRRNDFRAHRFKGRSPPRSSPSNIVPMRFVGYCSSRP
eukprot:3582254-Pyramimonas_sp.AAC.1